MDCGGTVGLILSLIMRFELASPGTLLGDDNIYGTAQMQCCTHSRVALE